MDDVIKLPIYKRRSFKVYLSVLFMIILYFAVSSPDVLNYKNIIIMFFFIIIVSVLYLFYTSYRHPSDRYLRCIYLKSKTQS